MKAGIGGVGWSGGGRGRLRIVILGYKGGKNGGMGTEVVEGGPTEWSGGAARKSVLQKSSNL